MSVGSTAPDGRDATEPLQLPDQALDEVPPPISIAIEGGVLGLVGAALGISVADVVRRIVDRYRGEREGREQRDQAEKDKRNQDRGGRP